MKTTIEEEVTKAIRARAKFYMRARRVIQVAFFILTATVGSIVFLATSNWIIVLWTIVLWIMIPTLIIVAILGRFWCGWFCPLGMILDFVGIIFNRTRKNPEQNYVKSARYWCRRLCPLGAFLGLSNRIEFLKLIRDGDKCGGAMCPIDYPCTKECPMGADVLDRKWRDPLCIRCNTCISVCELGALRPSCYFSRRMERTCAVFKRKLEILPSPLGSLYLYLKLKILGFKSVKKYGSDTIFSCTQCNRCHLATLRRTLMKSFINHKMEPKGLTSLRNAIMKYGSPYGRPEFRFALLPESYANATTSSRVFFAGCTSCYRAPELLMSALALLEDSKIEFTIMPDEICCGFPLYILGYEKEAKELAQLNIKMLKKRGTKEIITLCPGCYLAFKTFYKDFPGFNVEVKHVLEVLKPKAMVSGLSVTIHDPCHLDKELNKIAWRALEGNRVRKSSESCCGALLLSHDPKAAMEIAQRVMNTPSRYVTTHCPSCYLILSTVRPDKMIDFYTLLRARSKDDIKRLKEWVEEMHARARSLRRRRLTSKSVSTSPEA